MLELLEFTVAKPNNKDVKLVMLLQRLLGENEEDERREMGEKREGEITGGERKI